MGKGEIAHYEQFLLFPECFQETLTADTEKAGLVWERVKKWTALYRIIYRTRVNLTRHNSADSVPTSNLVCIKEVAIRTTLCVLLQLSY